MNRIESNQLPSYYFYLRQLIGSLTQLVLALFYLALILYVIMMLLNTTLNERNKIISNVSLYIFLRSDYEFVSNYKLLQAAFTKNHVQRFVDVDKLIRAKYQGE